MSLAIKYWEITPDDFDYVGGRCKLIIGKEPVSLLTGDIVVREAYKKKMQKQQAAEERQRRKKEEEQRRRIVEFLKGNHFDPDDVNAAGSETTRCLGLLRSWRQPLHQAAKDRDVDMILLLLKFGADPTKKDSKGKTAYDHVKCSALRNRMRALHSKVRAEGGLSLGPEPCG